MGLRALFLTLLVENAHSSTIPGIVQKLKIFLPDPILFRSVNWGILTQFAGFKDVLKKI